MLELVYQILWCHRVIRTEQTTLTTSTKWKEKTTENYLSNKFHFIIKGLLDAIAKGLLNDEYVSSARVLAINVTNNVLVSSVWWSKNIGGLGGPHRIDETGIKSGFKPSNEYPWCV